MKIATILNTVLSRTRSIAAELAGLTVPLIALATLAAPGHASFGSDQDYRAEDGSGARGGADNDPGTYARVRFYSGTLKLERYEDETVDEGAVNAPIMPGDTAATSGGGRAEIQLAGGSVVRLDENTRLSFMSLPAAGGAGDDATLLQLLEGSATIEVRSGATRKGEFQIDSPAASVYLLSKGRYRVDIESARGRTRVSTYRGVAEVAGDDGSVMLRSGQRTWVDAGNEPDEGRAFNTASGDSFDRWVHDRSGEYYRASAWNAGEDIDEEAIPDPVRPYRSELSYYGRWVTIPQYGPCWMPSGVGAGWRPYYNGYWSTGLSGSFWVSSDPWGWAPYHFGRWSWYSGYGWVWIPGSSFSGAWVSWYYGPSYVGWAPLDFWDYPCAFNRGYSGIDYRCWNFVTYQNVYVKHVTKIYLNPTVVRTEVGHGTGVIVRRPVRVTPADIRTRRMTPEAVIRRARSLGNDVVVDTVKERGSKRTFIDREKANVQASVDARRHGGPARRDPDVGTRPSAGRGEAGAPQRIPSRPPRLQERAGDRGQEAVRPDRHDRGNTSPSPRARPREGARSPSGEGHEAVPSGRDRHNVAPPARRRRLAGTESDPSVPPAGESEETSNGVVPRRPEYAERPGTATGDEPIREFLRETGKRPGRAGQDAPQTREVPPAGEEPERTAPERRTQGRPAPDTSARPERPRDTGRESAPPREQARGGSSDRGERPKTEAQDRRQSPERAKPAARAKDKPTAEPKKDRPKR